jgi:hypothetical protein
MSNPTRPCWGCETFDDHPRHEIAAAAGDPPLEDNLLNGPMHMDCCADLRGCAICARARSGVGAEVIGQAFRDHLLELPPVLVEHVPNDDPGDPHNLTTVVLHEIEV